MSLLSRGRGRIAAETGVVVLLAAAVLAWFGALPAPSGSPLLALGAALGALAAAAALLRPWPRPQAYPETLAVLALAVAYRLPALVHPWGWVNTDGAYGAFIALRLLDGPRPAPVFTEGASYQGTLKGHLAALFSLLGGHDLSRMLVLASLVLDLVFIAATMALSRRIGGRAAAVASGLYLALGPKFLTVFSLNSVGQYVDVLALGGLALAVLAPLLAAEAEAGHPRLRAIGAGLLLGAAFWQQPIAIAYVLAAVSALALRRGPGTGARWGGLLGGGLVGVLPVIVWNTRHGWATRAVVAPDGAGLWTQLGALPYLARRTADTSLPVLGGVSPGHPWLDVAGPAVRVVAALIVPAALAAFLVLRGREIAVSIRAGRPAPALLPPLLLVATLAVVWSTAAGGVYSRPRYLLPVMAATAVHLGVAGATLWRRRPIVAVLALAALLALNVSGMLSRLRDGGPTEAYYRSVLRSLEDKGIRTGYADFSLSAPVTMFTRERILLSSRLGPTPAYEPEDQTARVAREGPDAYVLRPDDDPERFAAVLRALGVGYRVDLDPVPVFYGFSRRVRVEEVSGFRGDAGPPSAPGEE